MSLCLKKLQALCNIFKYDRHPVTSSINTRGQQCATEMK